MLRQLLVLLVVIPFAFPAFAEETQSEKKRTGRPGELTQEEEDRIDRIIDRFIKFDAGRLGGAEGKKALQDFNNLGPEAIPGLIRGLNKAATMRESCPATTIAKKLNRLLASTDNPEILDFARENIGAGLKNTPYEHLFNRLKVTCILRKRALYEMKNARRTTPAIAPSYPSSGSRSPGSPGGSSSSRSPGYGSPGSAGTSPGSRSPGRVAPMHRSPGQRSPGEAPPP